MGYSSNMFISRGFVGTLDDPGDCALKIGDRLSAMRSRHGTTSLPKMVVACDRKSRVYASVLSNTMDEMLEHKSVFMVGTYTSECPLRDIADDIREAAKEYAESA